MAVDQTQKALNMADATLTAVKEFMSALEDLQSLENQRVKDNINLLAFNDDYLTISTIQHLDGTRLIAVLNTSIPAIASFMADNDHDDAMEAVRDGTIL